MNDNNNQSLILCINKYENYNNPKIELTRLNLRMYKEYLHNRWSFLVRKRVN